MNRHVAKRTRKTQRGIAIVWFMISLTALLGMAAFTFDVSLWMHEKALAKRAADAAALAAAWCESGNACKWSGSTVTPQQMADNYAQVNGATSNVTLTYPYAGKSNWVNVVVRIPMSTVFSGIFGITGNGKYIEETSTADFTGQRGIRGSGGLGVDSAFNYSVFGPLAYHSYGDEWSTKYQNSGSINTNYTSGGGHNGYYFNLNFSKNYQSTFGSKFQVELFDPSCYVSGSGQQVDEIRGENPNIAYKESTDVTTTWYTIQYENPSTNGAWVTATSTNSGAPATVSFSSETWPHLQWVDNPNMQIDLSQYPADTSFRVNVTSTDPTLADPVHSDTGLQGSSENGFNLRVGPPEPTNYLKPAGDSVNQIVTMGEDTSQTSGQIAEESDWAGKYSANGIDTSTSGWMELNINNKDNGASTETAVPLDFGNIPSDALGGTFTVTRFDTDVGAQALSYTEGGTATVPGSGSTPSNLSIANGGIANSRGDNTTYTDTFTVNTAGEIWGYYTGGTADTSDWTASYTGYPGRIALVGQSGLSY